MKWLTAKDIASDLQMSEDFIYKNVLRFGGEKFGYSWRFPPDAIERYRQSFHRVPKNVVRVAAPKVSKDEDDPFGIWSRPKKCPGGKITPTSDKRERKGEL